MSVHAQLSCLTLCHPMDCSPPGCSVHGIFQVRILEYVAISFSSGSPQPRNRTHISFFSALVGGFFTSWVTRQESQGACQRNDFSESKLLHLPIYRKVLNSLIWYILLSLTNSNLLMYQLLVFLAKLLFTLVPPLSLWSSPSELSESLPPRLEGLRKSAKWKIILNF